MAFTFGEFLRGAAFTWLAFNVIIALGFAGIGLVAGIASGDRHTIGFAPIALLFSLYYSAPVSLAVLIVVAAPLAIWLGRALRKRARLGLHLGAFSALGVAIGLLISLVLPVWSLWIMRPTPSLGEFLLGWLPAGLALAAVTAASVLIGWCTTAAFALRADRRAASGV